MSVISSATAVNIRFGVVIFACLVGAGLSIAYVLTDQRRAAKKPIYAWKAAILTLAAIIYLIALFQENIYLVKSGWATQIVLFMLVCALIANVISDWRKK